MSDDLVALAREGIDAFNDGDWGRFEAVLAPGSVYDEPGTGRRVEGIDAIMEVNRSWKAAFPDAKGTIHDVFACGDKVVTEVTWSGTHRGDLPLPDGGSIPASGQRIETRAVQVERVEDGKVAETHHYFDMLGMLEQIGALSPDALAAR